jgi:hypothetical protein
VANFARAYCDALMHCPDPRSVDVDWRAFVGTVDRCVTLLGPKLAETLRPFGTAVAAGRARFDPTEGRRCVDAVRAVCTHDPEFLLGSVCSRVYTGTVASGGACRLTAECTGDAFCTTFGTPCGICRPRGALGGTCSGGYDRCSRPTTGWSECTRADETSVGSTVCRAARLVTGAAVGQPCGVRATSADAIERVVCVDGAWCTAERGGVGTCRAHLPPGAACMEGEVCVTTARCVRESATSTMGVCRTLSLTSTVNGPCGDTPTSPQCDLVARLWCRGGMCRDGGSGTLGSACDLEHLLVPCGPGLVCGDSPRTCRALLPIGATCGGDRQCASGWCDEVPGVGRRCSAGAC